MRAKKTIVIIAFVALFVFCSCHLLAKDENINIKAPRYNEIERIVLYYHPFYLQGYSRINKEQLKKSYYYRVEALMLSFAFSDIKQHVKDVLSIQEFEPTKDSLDYRVIIEFWGKDRILYEYALGYRSSMEINGITVKKKKEFFKLVQMLLPPSEGNELYQEDWQ